MEKCKIWVDDMTQEQKELAFKAVKKLDKFYNGKSFKIYVAYFIHSEDDIGCDTADPESKSYYDGHGYKEITLRQLLKLAGMEGSEMSALRYYTDDFDQEMLDFIRNELHMEADNEDEWEVAHKHLVYSSNLSWYWTCKLRNPEDYEYLTKAEMKEKIGMATKTFSKKDLKDGMRLINRDGNTYYLLGSNLLTYDRKAYLGHGAFSQATYITNYYDSLVHPSFKGLDIMKVIDRDDKVLFVREEKSETEIQFEKLQQQITELQSQADKLKATL